METWLPTPYSSSLKIEQAALLSVDTPSWVQSIQLPVAVSSPDRIVRALTCISNQFPCNWCTHATELQDKLAPGLTMFAMRTKHMDYRERPATVR